MAALRLCTTISGEFSNNHIKEAMSGANKLKFFTVPVLLKMLELFAVARADGSNFVAAATAKLDTNVFLGADFDGELMAMSLLEGQRGAEIYRNVLIYLDEIPALDVARMTHFQECLYLRNMIRCLILPCLLSGTESTLLDVMACVQDSRTDDRTEYAWLLAKFPATQLDQLTEKIDRFGEYEQYLLNQSRPLFARWFVECFGDLPVSPVAAASHGTVRAASERVVAAASQGAGLRMLMTPETLTKMKRAICKAKANTSVDAVRLSWLHASTLLLFADSLAGNGTVRATVATEDAAHVGEKRAASSSMVPSQPRKKRKISDIRDNVKHHSLVIKKHFALLHIAQERIDKATGMVKLFVEGDVLYMNNDESPFKVKAAFPSCAEDPLLYLSCLRGGLMYRRRNDAEFEQVPSSYAFSTFIAQSSAGNRLARSNDGTGWEAECMAAVVLAAHRYTSFDGTPFLRWLELVIAELNQNEVFQKTPISDVPEELHDSLQALLVPLLSPPNCVWGEETMNSGINMANLIWCKNKDMRDGLVPLEKPDSVHSDQKDKDENDKKTKKEEEKEEDEEDDEGEMQGEAEFFFAQGHNFTSLALEIKDTKDGFGGDNMVAVTQKVAEGSVTVLICSHLADWKESTKKKFAKDLSVYRMKNQGSIECVSIDKWAPGRKLLIALDLSTLHPGRCKALPHST